MPTCACSHARLRSNPIDHCAARLALKNADATLVTAPAHPAPSTMAHEAYPGECRSGSLCANARAHFAAGVAAERARVAEDMRGRSRIRASEAEAFALTFPQPESSGAELRGASIELAEYADELEGKVTP